MVRGNTPGSPTYYDFDSNIIAREKELDHREVQLNERIMQYELRIRELEMKLKKSA